MSLIMLGAAAVMAETGITRSQLDYGRQKGVIHFRKEGDGPRHRVMYSLTDCEGLVLSRVKRRQESEGHRRHKEYEKLGRQKLNEAPPEGYLCVRDCAVILGLKTRERVRKIALRNEWGTVKWGANKNRVAYLSTDVAITHTRRVEYKAKQGQPKVDPNQMTLDEWTEGHDDQEA